jgi:hypothetical protein
MVFVNDWDIKVPFEQEVRRLPVCSWFFNDCFCFRFWQRRICNGRRRVGLSFWGEWSLFSTVTRLSLVHRQLFITHFNTGYCFHNITFKEMFSKITHPCNQTDMRGAVNAFQLHVFHTVIRCKEYRMCYVLCPIWCHFQAAQQSSII